MGVILCFIGLLAVCLAQFDEFGACKTITSDTTAHALEKFVTMEGGKWQVRMVPKTDLTNKISWMSLDVLRNELRGGYVLKISSEIYGFKEIGYNEYHVQDSHGSFITSNTGNAQIQFIVLKYIPNEYAFCYICVRNGGKSNVNYRYVLAHDKLSEEQQKNMKRIDTASGFDGDLHYIV